VPHDIVTRMAGEGDGVQKYAVITPRVVALNHRISVSV